MVNQETHTISVKIERQLKRLHTLHKQVSLELPVLIEQENQRRVVNEGAQTLYIEDESNAEEIKGEEVHELEDENPQFDSDMIAKLLERSAQVIQSCQATIQKVETTQQHITEVQLGCQETLQMGDQHTELTEQLQQTVFADLIKVTEELDAATQAKMTAKKIRVERIWK